MAFFPKFSFRCSFYFVPEFRFTQICAAFQLEMGQQARLHLRFFVFRPNSIILASEMKFFPKIFILVLILFCARIQIRTNVCSFSIGCGSKMMSAEEVHRFSAKFHVSAPKKAFFKKILFRCSFYLVLEFRFAQIYVAFRLEMGQRG